MTNFPMLFHNNGRKGKCKLLDPMFFETFLFLESQDSFLTSSRLEFSMSIALAVLRNMKIGTDPIRSALEI